MNSESINLMAMISAQLTKIIDQRIELHFQERLQSQVRNALHLERDYLIGIADQRIAMKAPSAFNLKQEIRELAQEGGLNSTIEDTIGEALAEYLDSPGNIDAALARADLSAVIESTIEGMDIDVTLKFN